MKGYYKSKRKCEICGADIGHHPSNHTLCDVCYSASSDVTYSYGSGGKATDKQVRLLLELRDEGYIDDVYFKGLSISEASHLIDKGISKKRGY
jgi:hypothetical protein